MSRVLVTPVVSLPHPSNWSQVVEYAQPTFQCVLAVTVFGRHAKSIGKTLVQMVKSTDLSSVEQFYEALLSCKRLAEESSAELHFSSVYFSGLEMMCVAQNGIVCLKREGRSGRVVVAGSELQVRMGKQQAGDVVLLATEASGFFVNEVEQKFAQGYETDTIITSILPGVQSAGEQQPCVLAFLSQDEGAFSQVAAEGLISGARELVSDRASSELLTTTESEGENDDQVGSVTRDAVTRRTSKELGGEEKQRGAESVVRVGRVVGAAVRRTAALLGVGTLRLLKSAQELKLPLRGGVYLDQDRHTRVMRMVVLAALALVVIGGLWWWYARSQERARQEATAVVAPFVLQLQEAQALVSNDPVTARKQVARVVTQLEDLRQSELQSAVAAEFVSQELTRAKDLFTAISGKEELSELPIFYDLRLIRSDFVASLAQGGGKRAVFIDQGKQQAAVLDLQSKQLFLISLAEVGVVRSAVVQDDQLFVLADGVFAFPIQESSLPKKVIEAGDSNKGGQLLGAYEKYLYVLNPDKRNIYRYLQQSGEYSKPIGWLASSLGSSLQDTVSIAIDGDFWLTTQAGEIRKFSSGRQQEFVLKGLPDSFTTAVQLVTAVELEHLYVLDSSNKRVVILEKDGTFLRQVTHPSLGSATALVVSVELQKALVLSGSMIFEVAL